MVALLSRQHYGRLRCLKCGAWAAATWTWTDGLTFTGSRCEYHARLVAEQRAARRGAPFAAMAPLPDPPPAVPYALPEPRRRTL